MFVWHNFRQHFINNSSTLRTSFCALYRFSPELLGVQASSALVWLIMEVLAVLLSLYLVTVNTDLTTIDLLAFSGYKYVGCVPERSIFGLTFPFVVLPYAAFSLIAFLKDTSVSLFVILIWGSVGFTVCVCVCMSHLQDDHRGGSRPVVWEAGILSLSTLVLCCHLCLYGE